MGRFFTSTQIYNPKQLDCDAFAASFCKKMKQEGYELCEADCAELSYVLAFADNCKWVTISSEVYEQGNQTSQADTARIARMLGTYCVNTIVIDSDCAMLDLYDDKGKKADTAVMGRADDYFGDDILEPTKAVWEQFLSAGSTWEQLTAVMQGSYVFVEDGLAELAPMIGMDSRRILFAFENANENDANVHFLSFKKNDSKKEKKLTLNSAFVKVFGDGLAPLGFVRLKKTKQPFFVRLINNEILHVITYRSTESFDYGYKTFEILGGIATVYRKELNLGASLLYHLNWLNNSFQFYNKTVKDAEPERCEDNITEFSYKENNNESMLTEMERAFKITSKYVIPTLSDAVDLYTCIEYFYEFQPGMLAFNSNESPTIENIERYGGECLTLIKADYRDDHTARWQNECDRMVKAMVKGKIGFTQAEFEKWRDDTEKARAGQLFVRTQLLDDPELNFKVSEELERRKVENLTKIQSYGIKI